MKLLRRTGQKLKTSISCPVLNAELHYRALRTDFSQMLGTVSLDFNLVPARYTKRKRSGSSETQPWGSALSSARRKSRLLPKNRDWQPEHFELYFVAHYLLQLNCVLTGFTQAYRKTVFKVLTTTAKSPEGVLLEKVHRKCWIKDDHVLQETRPSL